MFRAHPGRFLLAGLLIMFFGISLPFLLIWFVRTRTTRLVVTKTDILFEKGILSKDRIEMSVLQINAIRVRQGLINRIFGVGAIEVYTAGDLPEFAVSNIPRPHKLRDTIRRVRNDLNMRGIGMRLLAPPSAPHLGGFVN